LFCLFAIAGMAGSELVAWYTPARPVRPTALAGVTALATGLLLCAGFSSRMPFVVLALFLMMNFCGGLSLPIYQSWFNERIEGEHRATLLSFQSTFATLGARIGLPGLGRIVDRVGIGASWQAAAVLSA